MARKSSKYSRKGIEKLPDDKPVVYRIETTKGKPNCIGTAQRGRARERLEEHLERGRDHVTGAKVKIEQRDSIVAARAREAQLIEKLQPKYNEKGK